MPALPTRFVVIIVAFSALFRQQRMWHRAASLLIGALLVSGRRTVTSVLRVLGHAQDRHFGAYHRVLSRACWSPRAASRILLQLLVRAFAPTGPLVFGLDDTIERRWGKRIRARGIYRDPVRASDHHFVKTSGLRWLSVMLLAPIPWAHRVWALPVLTVLAPSARADTRAGRHHKTLVDWARQAMRQLARWCAALAPGRALIMVADLSFAAHPLLRALAPGMTCITRLRLDGRLFAPPPPVPPGVSRWGKWARPRVVGPRLPALTTVLEDAATVWTRVAIAGWYGPRAREVELASGTALWYQGGHPVVPIRWVLIRDPAGRFDAQALLSTDPALGAEQIVAYYVRRWQVEVTFQEARRHLGLETQRQWSELAIARTTPVLLGLFSLVTLLATTLDVVRLRRAAWYPKPVPTFSDALVAVRQHCWRAALNAQIFRRPHHGAQKISARRFYHYLDAILDGAA